jgi:hypothetical protein
MKNEVVYDTTRNVSSTSMSQLMMVSLFVM